jgi:YNFM family putative membrane transporter
MEAPARRPAPALHRAALYLGTVAVYADMYVTQPVLPLLTREFGVAPSRAGLTVSAVVLAIAAASSLYGPLGDALGRKAVMVWSSALLVVPTLLCAVSPTFGLLVGLRAAQGLLIPGVTAVAVAYIGEEFEPREVGSVVGAFIAASVVGGLSGRVGSGLVADAAGWRASFLVFGGTTLAGALLMAVGLRRRPGAAPLAWSSATSGLFRHLGDRRLVGAYLIGGALFFGFIAIFTYLPYRLVAPPFSLSTSLVSSVYLVYLAGVVASPLAGRLSARVSARALMGAGLLIAALGAAATLSPSLPVVVTGLVVLCLGMFTAQAIAPSYVNRQAREAKGGASALYLAFYYVGGTLGSSLPGFAWEGFGWPGVVAASLAAILVGLVANALLCR